MNRLVFIFFALFFLVGSQVRAGQVELAPGQSLTIGETTVTCRGTAAISPLELRDCQHWDKFNRTCLYEKRTQIWKELKCENSCEVWDDFNGICLYESKCRFVPEQELFIRTTCSDYDRFNKVCRRTSDQLIR